MRNRVAAVVSSLLLFVAAEGWAAEGAISIVATTTSSVTTGSSFPQGYDARVIFALFPREPLSFAELNVKYDDLNYGGVYDLDSVYCDILMPARVTHDGTNFEMTFDVIPGGLTQSQNVLSCGWFTHEPASPAGEDWFIPSVVLARNVTNDDATSSTRLCATHFDINRFPVQDGARHLCGDANADDTVTAGDALQTLQAAIVGRACAPSLCDTDADAAITAGDALRILRRSSSLAVDLFCAPPCL